MINGMFKGLGCWGALKETSKENETKRVCVICPCFGVARVLIEVREFPSISLLLFVDVLRC